MLKYSELSGEVGEAKKKSVEGDDDMDFHPVFSKLACCV
jgi:hypothetical protein